MPRKRQRRTKAEIEALDAQILAMLEADNPQSVRHVFDRLSCFPEREQALQRAVRRRLVRQRATLVGLSRSGFEPAEDGR